MVEVAEVTLLLQIDILCVLESDGVGELQRISLQSQVQCLVRDKMSTLDVLPQADE
jgi:hypothetical protein